MDEECKRRTRRVLVRANTDQDQGESFDDLRRHFNREPNQSRQDAGQAWNDYVVSEFEAFDNAMDSDPPHCEEALKALGRVSHSLQDYWAHGVGNNGEWIVLSDPDVGGWHPSSYPGEHPPLPWEPFIWIRAETDAREALSQSDTDDLFMMHLPWWWRECKCWCCGSN